MTAYTPSFPPVMAGLVRIASLYCGVWPSVQVPSSYLNPEALVLPAKAAERRAAHSMAEDTDRGGGSDFSLKRLGRSVVTKRRLRIVMAIKSWCVERIPKPGSSKATLFLKKAEAETVGAANARRRDKPLARIILYLRSIESILRLPHTKVSGGTLNYGKYKDWQQQRASTHVHAYFGHILVATRIVDRVQNANRIWCVQKQICFSFRRSVAHFIRKAYPEWWGCFFMKIFLLFDEI